MPKKITSKADLAVHDASMRVGGHDFDTNRGILSSTDTMVADILAAAQDAGLQLDEATVRHVAEADARAQLNHLLQVNRNKYDFKYNFFMHNHGAQLLLAFYRLGADGRKMEEAFLAESAEYEPAFKTQGRVTKENWQSLIGVDHPPPGPPDFSKPKTATHYEDFRQFFIAEIAENGVEATVQMVGAEICDGVAGDLAHAIIELGYAFELPPGPSGQYDADLVAGGLAWMCVGCKAIPGMNTTPSTNRAPGGEGRTISNREPNEMWAQIFADERIPKMTTTTGPMGFDENMGRLMGTPGMPQILADYDFEITEDDDPIAAGRKVSDAVVTAFGASGFKDFFLLHLATGMRAVESTLPHLGDAEVQRRMVRAFWKVCVYIYVARGAPSTEAASEYLNPAGVRGWEEIVNGVLTFKDAHLAKLVHLARDFFHGAANGNPIYQVMADKATAIIEAGGDWEQY